MRLSLWGLGLAAVLVSGCDTAADKPDKAAAAQPTATPELKGGDYLSTSFRARQRAQDQLKKVAAERETQIREEQEFSEKPTKPKETEPEP